MYHVRKSTNENAAGNAVKIPGGMIYLLKIRQNLNCRRRVINKAAHISKKKKCRDEFPKTVTHKT